MSFGGGSGGAGMSGGADFQRLTSDIIAHFKSKKDARKAEQLYRKRYQTMVNDLKAAGLNPMLAYGGLGAMPSFPETPGGGGGALHLAPPFERELKKQERETSAASAKRIGAEEAVAREQVGLIQQQKDTSSAQEADLRQAAILKQAESQESNARRNLLHQDLIMKRIQQQKEEATKLPYRVFNRLMESLETGAKAISERGKRRQQQLRGSTYEEYREKYLRPLGPKGPGY